MKKPKRWRSWRVCPNCGNRATKMLSINDGKYRCQICNHAYDGPVARDGIEAQYGLNDTFPGDPYP